jgi:hypothetical protein
MPVKDCKGDVSGSETAIVKDLEIEFAFTRKVIEFLH